MNFYFFTRNRNSIFIFLFFYLLGSTHPSFALPIELDGNWSRSSCESCGAGSFFSDSWDWSSTNSVKFDVTDGLVIAESFAIYDFGSLVFSTPDLLNYIELGATDYENWTQDAEVAFNSDFWSSGSYLFSAGSHSITIQTLEDIPRFDDHHVSVRATEIVDVPEPVSLLLFLSGISGLLLSRIKNRG